MSLLDLPPELPALIAQHVGPAELRKSFDYLLVSRAWYWAVLPIYLSGLQLSTIYVLSNDLDRFPHPDTNPLLSQAIQKTVTRLSLCLDGLPSRDTLSWDDQREFSEETHQWLDQTIYYHRNGSAETLQKRLKVVIADGKIQPRIREGVSTGGYILKALLTIGTELGMTRYRKRRSWSIDFPIGEAG